MTIKRLLGLTTGLIAVLLIAAACGQQEDTTDETAYEEGEELAQPDPEAQERPQPQQPQQPQDMDVDVSSEEIELFAEVWGEIEELQADLQGETDEILQDEGLSEDRYNQIMMEQQGMGQEEAAEATDEEMEQFRQVQERLQVLQQGLEENAIQMMEDKGLPFERYQEIQMALQQDPELQQELMQHLDQPAQQEQPPAGR